MYYHYQRIIPTVSRRALSFVTCVAKNVCIYFAALILFFLDFTKCSKKDTTKTVGVGPRSFV